MKTSKIARTYPSPNYVTLDRVSALLKHGLLKQISNNNYQWQ